MQKEILKAAIFTPLAGEGMGLPVLCWGEPGAAKTAMIDSFGKSFGLEVEILSPSERGEGAFGVVPVPDGDVLRYPRPAWTTKFDKSRRGLVFIDELGSVEPMLQRPIMALVLAKRIGDYVLPPGVRVIGAGNPPNQATGGTDLATPLANRFCHLSWSPPTIEEHASYMLSGAAASGADRKKKASDEDPELDAELEEERVLLAWPEAWAKAVGLETAFLGRRPHLKNKCPPEGDPAASRGWPSDRSWENATRALASAKIHGLTQSQEETFVAGFISEGVANEWYTFIEKQDLPDPAAILDGKERFVHERDRLDRTFATLSACAALVTPTTCPRRRERVEAIWNLLASLTEKKLDMDILVPACQALSDAKLIQMGLKSCTSTMATMRPMLSAVAGS